MKISKNIAVSESGFIFNPTTGDSFSCNAVAADIINLLKENMTLEQVKSRIMLKYEVQESEIDKDLQDLWLQLRDNNLLEI
jgi:diphthamide synthase (EF-2-diphthine--ammonia ligase)